MKNIKETQPLPGAVTADPARSAVVTRGRTGARLVPAYALIVLVVSFLVYGFNYAYSPGLFWDENYHITSAQKYLDGVFFMGDHPPLGKELIAAGELLLRQNSGVDTSSFLTVEKADAVPKGYSFKGVRFVPSFLAVLGGVLFFFLLLELLEDAHLALAFSALYLFENAFVVHSRGAMLDSIQLFFILASLWCFVPLLEDGEQRAGRHFLLGLLVGASTAVKLNGLLFASLPLILFLRGLGGKKRPLTSKLRSSLACLAGFLLLFLGSYVVHIELTPRVMDGRYYGASPEYCEILDRGEAGALRNLPLGIVEHLLFIPRYQKGVPGYNPANPKENGSLPYTWPVMDKTIDYRWEKDGALVRYLYLVGNPLSWLLGLCAALLGVGYLLYHAPRRRRAEDPRDFRLILLFTSIYWAYLGVMMCLGRVMYLYHYFIPLLCAYLLAGLLCRHFFKRRLEKGGKLPYLVSGTAALLIFAVFLFFSPLTYYQPLTYQQFQLRNWCQWWKMTAVR